MCDTPLRTAVPYIMQVLCLHGRHRPRSPQLSGSMCPLVVPGPCTAGCSAAYTAGCEAVTASSSTDSGPGCSVGSAAMCSGSSGRALRRLAAAFAEACAALQALRQTVHAAAQGHIEGTIAVQSWRQGIAVLAAACDTMH
jgi:hypothetical protein